MNKFVLMHQNKPVANISIQKDENGDGYLYVDAIINRTELPYSLKNESLKRINVAVTWWNNTRCIPTGRPNYDKLLQNLKLSNSSEIIPYSYMCSLTDCYWFKPIDSHIRWEDVNFRDNGFSSNLYKCLFFGKDNVLINNLNSPDIPTDGAIPKMWIERDNNFYLVKRSMNQPPIDVYNELLASELLKQMGIPHVEYFIENFDEKPASVCQCFIPNNNCEFVQAENLITDGYYNTPNEYLNAMRNFGAKFQFDIDAMILADMVIGNVDRHTRNYGQIIDFETQKVICAAPIFDNGSCDFLKDVSKMEYKPTGMTFEETAKTLNNTILSLVERIDLEHINQLIDSFPIEINDKIKIKTNLSHRVSCLLELSRRIEYDFDRER